ncbi:hypothetical protein K431DRAFT_288440 [Polychaeton citri CBS 116435]|uniref:Peptidase S54 rhomboid domain-containing protein n=1 Tax=Polychaeton citri CBS 116435 TaxID=1314669 RepID=A0A9P4Q331_9PEZI|nr:hypothetical protein K431DRAFT_288440 [Polychaeton citri CBS 116435]
MMNFWLSAALATCTARNTCLNRTPSLGRQYSHLAHYVFRKPSVANHRFSLLQWSRSNSTNRRKSTRPRASLATPLPSKNIGTPSPTAEHTEGAVHESDSPLTWRDYDPTGGMPLRTTEFLQAEIDTIFDSSPDQLDTDRGNYILNVLNYRRMSGALIDQGITFPADTGVTRDQAVKGLQYVRSLDPTFDENAAGQQWVDEETQRLQDQLIQRAERLGIYKTIDVDQSVETVPEEEQQGTAHGRQRSGDSALIALRRENESRWEAEQAQKAFQLKRQAAVDIVAARGPLELVGGVQPSTALATVDAHNINVQRPPNRAWLQPVERKPWVKYYEERAQIIKDNSIPQLSLVARLAPALLFALLFVSLGVFLSDNYTPPPNSARMFPDTPPAVATLAALTGLLCLGFVAGRFPPFWRTLSKYFTLVPAYPYAVSLCGVIFRHDTLSHLAPNLAILWLLGLMLHEDVGRGTFLAVFFSSGVVGAYASLTHCVLSRSWMHYIYGSSGAVLGVVGAACTLHPLATISIAGYDMPIAAWTFVAAYGAMEIYALVRRRKGGTIDHGGHIGGMLTGILAGLHLRSRAITSDVHTDVVPKQ